MDDGREKADCGRLMGVAAFEVERELELATGVGRIVGANDAD